MKYAVLIGDGMADYPIRELGERTPLEAAYTPYMDQIAACQTGLFQSIPMGLEAGSDVANLAILGYDPRKYHTSRAPLEAAGMGVTLQTGEVAFRLNLVTLDHRSGDEIILDSHSAGEIGSAEAKELIAGLKQCLDVPGISIHEGSAYRHLLLWNKGPMEAENKGPQNFLGKNIVSYLNIPQNQALAGLVRRSWEILDRHPVNQRRNGRGQKPANSIWLWGQGKPPLLPLFKAKFGLGGAVVSALDLIKGIGVYIGLKPLHVEGATGYLHTNYSGKAEAALSALKEMDFVFVHVEAPDNAGHNGDFRMKIEAIERFDHKVVGAILKGLEDFDDFRIMVISDHFTPVVQRNHTADPTPFAWAGKEELHAERPSRPFNEKNAKNSGLFFEEPHEFMNHFLSLT